MKVKTSSLFHLTLLAMLLFSLTACASPVSSEEPLQDTDPDPTATPSLPMEERIRRSFLEPDPVIRLENVLRVTEAFLSHDDVIQMGDEEASIQFTTIAFSSEKFIFSDPAFIRRRDDQAVIGLPNGMGLYFFDLGKSNTSPVEISSWTVGLSAVEVMWQEEEIGVSFLTVGNDGITRVHFTLIALSDENWEIIWVGDEEPDWWFNAYNATLTISPSLNRLVVIGKALDTTPIFIEDETGLVRDFRVEWLRDENNYYVTPASGTYSDWQEWLWSVAEPSPYTTLVEFIERLQRGENEEEMSHLMLETIVYQNARDFGLHLADRQYQIAIFDEDFIVFRDRGGAFVTSFAQEGGSLHWLISSLNPVGAQPTPTPLPPIPSP